MLLIALTWVWFYLKPPGNNTKFPCSFILSMCQNCLRKEEVKICITRLLNRWQLLILSSVLCSSLSFHCGDVWVCDRWLILKVFLVISPMALYYASMFLFSSPLRLIYCTVGLIGIPVFVMNTKQDSFFGFFGNYQVSGIMDKVLLNCHFRIWSGLYVFV